MLGDISLCPAQARGLLCTVCTLSVHQQGALVLAVPSGCVWFALLCLLVAAICGSLVKGHINDCDCLLIRNKQTWDCSTTARVQVDPSTLLAAPTYAAEKNS
jgi:hypothetical protein